MKTQKSPAKLIIFRAGYEVIVKQLISLKLCDFLKCLIKLLSDEFSVISDFFLEVRRELIDVNGVVISVKFLNVFVKLKVDNDEKFKKANFG